MWWGMVLKRFCNNIWSGDQPLKQLFPELVSIVFVANKDAFVHSSLEILNEWGHNLGIFDSIELS